MVNVSFSFLILPTPFRVERTHVCRLFNTWNLIGHGDRHRQTFLSSITYSSRIKDFRHKESGIPTSRIQQKVMKEGEIPLRDERKVCYMARDAFFTCCDKNNIEHPTRDPELTRKNCGAEKAKFERDCVASWVSGPSAVRFVLFFDVELKLSGCPGRLLFEEEDHR
jgi:hypothetical protein